MAPSTKLEDKLEGIKNFLAWKYKISLILRQNGLEKYIKNEVAEPTEAKAKEKHEQDLIKTMRIIADSIKDHLIPKCHLRIHQRICMMLFLECMKEGTSTEI